MNVKLGKLIASGAVLVAFLCVAGAARADNVVLTGSVWTNGTSLNGFSAFTVPPAGTPDYTFTVSNTTGNIFNFYSSDDANLNTFLTNFNGGANGDTVNYVTGGSGSQVTQNNPCPSGSGNTCTGGINNDVMEFTGSAWLNQGSTYEVTHDDGIYLSINGGNDVWSGTAATPTAAETSSFQWMGASGSYNFTLWFAEVNGAPAVLESDLTTTPEPPSLFLLGFGLLGLAFLVFRKGVKTSSHPVLNT